jgi:hypothetical protein
MIKIKIENKRFLEKIIKLRKPNLDKLIKEAVERSSKKRGRKK